jgi:assimilatory nitrate reductase catalytic subunit
VSQGVDVALFVMGSNLVVSFHWGGAGRANTLTNDALDPDSKIPEYKIAAVAITKASEDDVPGDP